MGHGTTNRILEKRRACGVSLNTHFGREHYRLLQQALELEEEEYLGKHSGARNTPANSMFSGTTLIQK